jgi:hypothetical protein
MALDATSSSGVGFHAPPPKPVLKVELASAAAFQLPITGGPGVTAGGGSYAAGDMGDRMAGGCGRMKKVLLVFLAAVLTAQWAPQVHAQPRAASPDAGPESAPRSAPPAVADGAPSAGLTAPPEPAPAAVPPATSTPPVSARPSYAKVLGYPVTYPEPPVRPRPAKGMLIAGIASFSAGYLVGVVTGAVLVSPSQEDCVSCKDVGKFLFVPLAGPFLAMPDARFPSDYPLALLGIFQLGTAGMLVGSIVVYMRSKRRLEREPYPLLLHGLRRLAFDVHASPFHAGPSMTLRF